MLYRTHRHAVPRADIDIEELFTSDPQVTLVHVTGWGVLGARRATCGPIIAQPGTAACSFCQESGQNVVSQGP